MMASAPVDEMRSAGEAERLLEETWEERSRRMSRRELFTEVAAGALFVACALALLLTPHATAGFRPAVAAVLVALYVLVSFVEFPVGAGHATPTQLVLVPMLVLLPPATVPPLVAGGYALARLWEWARGEGQAQRVLFSVADAWYAVGPAVVLVLAGSHGVALGDWPLLAAALACGLVVDAAAATIREASCRGIAPRLQVKVVALVWIVDAALAPVGALAAIAGRDHLVSALAVLPLAGLLMVMARDRNRRIEQGQQRLALAVRERARLQSAVRRMGDGFAARLDLDALVDILVRGSIEALDADVGWLATRGREPRRLPEGAMTELDDALHAAGSAAMAADRPEQIGVRAGWALALPFSVAGQRPLQGAVCIARTARPFQDDEVSLLAELVAKGRSAAADIVGHHALREQALSDPLTGLGNRRKLTEELGAWLRAAETTSPRLLMSFDLDGFKAYNDTFGHPAGDALLARLGEKLCAATSPYGEAFRLGGDEFCALLQVDSARVEEVIAAAAGALAESGEEFAISASYGVVLLPHEARTLEQALQLADERMYSHKHERSGAREQARDVLMRTMQAKQPNLSKHSSEVAQLAVAVARRLGMQGEEVDEVARAAELHDVGKVGIPDAILDKPAALDGAEWEFMRQHTILGERILNAAPALRPVATIVRSTHERWDGAGYPDGLRGEEIPRGARIVAVCDAYEAMTADRAYRRARPHEAACEELVAMAGTQFDPEVVAVFVSEIERRAAHGQDAPGEDDAPLRAVAERVRSLLQTA
jgi:diguanylate cyclase (GGDEF)-like protein/putative nucleotidyltransferase with HDIG domain